MTEAEIAHIIRAYTFIYLQSKEGKTLPTQNIEVIEIKGIEEAAHAIASLLNKD